MRIPKAMQEMFARQGRKGGKKGGSKGGLTAAANMTPEQRSARARVAALAKAAKFKQKRKKP